VAALVGVTTGCSASADESDTDVTSACRAFEINDAQLAEATVKHRHGLVSKSDLVVYDQALGTLNDLMTDPGLPEPLYDKMLEASLAYVATRREASLIADSWDWDSDKVGRVFDQREAASASVIAACDKSTADD
jgi:hypothetical protein